MSQEKRTTTANALIWFGAGVSIAEIYTGTLMAPLGMWRGMLAVIVGHAIGGFIMYLAALIGGLSQRGAMESVELSFGKQGAKFFAALNVLQLVGWTAVMIAGGSISLGIILNPTFGTTNTVWCGVIGVLIAIWIMLDMKNFERVNRVAMAALFILTIVLSFIVFRNGTASPTEGSMSLAEAIELTVAMPLSWLPLISDYMRDAEEPRKSAAVSTLVYSLTSCWMYFIGLGVAIYTAGSDVGQIMLEAGLGIAGVIIVAFSTVTTTFLDAYSAGISFHVIASGVKEKAAGIAVCAIGTFIAMYASSESYESLLYLISSVFAPMAAVMVTDFFILKHDTSHRQLSIRGIILWAIGFALYRYLLTTSIPVGATLPVIAVTIILTWISGRVFPEKQ